MGAAGYGSQGRDDEDDGQHGASAPLPDLQNSRYPKTKTRQVAPPRSKSRKPNTKNPYSSSSCFLPPMVFSLANTASTLRSARCFSVGSNSGSLRAVVSEAGSRVAPP